MSGLGGGGIVIIALLNLLFFGSIGAMIYFVFAGQYLWVLASLTPLILIGILGRLLG